MQHRPAAGPVRRRNAVIALKNDIKDIAAKAAEQNEPVER